MEPIMNKSFRVSRKYKNYKEELNSDRSLAVLRLHLFCDHIHKRIS